MGIIFMDGFEKNSRDQWSSAGGTPVIRAASGYAGMSGNYCLDLGANLWTTITKIFTTDWPEWHMTFRNINSGGNDVIVTFKDNTGASILALGRNTGNGRIYAKRGSRSGTTLAEGGVLWPGINHHFKIHYVPLNSGGTIQVWQDNVLIIDYTGDTTGGNENVAGFHCSDGEYGWSHGIYDDFVISTEDITTNIRVLGKAVTADGAHAEWSPSVSPGDNYAMVDEKPPVHTDYNSTNITDEIDTFTLEDIAEEVSNIVAVQVELACAYEGSPTPTHIQACLRLNSADYFGPDISPPSVLGTPRVTIWETNPGASPAAAFTEEDINSMEAGYKATA